MENKIFLKRYRLSLSRNGLPVELHRTPAAITYRAQERESGREVALELVPGAPPDAASREKLRAEATAAKQINHINIPVLYDFGIEDDHLVYVTEYFDGHTAEAWVAARGPLPPRAVLRVALQVVGALGAAVFHRIHHHALNPANVIFVPGQTTEGDWPPVKVLHWLGMPPTFAAAPATDSARLDAMSRYASPEQLRDGEVDFRSEIYSLGCTMWFLLTGAAPAVAWHTSSEAPSAPPAVEQLRGVPKIVRHLLGRMLRSDPNERPQDPVALSAYLQTCLGRVERREAMGRRFGIPVSTRPHAIVKPPRRPIPRKPLALAAALLALATLGALTLPRYFHGRALLQTANAAEQNKSASSVPNDSNTALIQGDGLTADESSISQTPVIAANSVSAQGPREEMAGRVVESSAPEPARPAEGPATVTASNQQSPATVETELPTSPATVSSEEPAIIPDNGLPADQIDTSAGDAPVKKFVSKSVARKKTPTRSRAKAESVAKTAAHSKTHSQKKAAVVKMESPGKRAVPPLHVGSVRARLVGTTPDGKWILALASSGRRIIVPPPPGFEQ